MPMRFLCSLLLAGALISASLVLTGCGDSDGGLDGLYSINDPANQPTTIKAGGRMFFDEFDEDGLAASWRPTRGAFTASGGVLVESSGQRFIDAQLLWEGGVTDSPDQLGKMQVVEKASRSWGFILRAGGAHHYEVHLPANSTRWRWELNDPDFVERIDECASDAAVENGDWLGATAVGSGTDVVVSVWRWDTDPDFGALPNPDAWGPPDCVMTGDPSVVSDERGLGIRSYTGNSTAPGLVDHWAAGDIPGGECGNGIPEPGEDCDDGGETATCNANCTLAGCGDGFFNSLAEQCEFDANCSIDEVCSASCLCEVPPPPPVCGNGILEGGEACDDGGESSECDLDCTVPACDDGVFNPVAEQCEQNADCAVGELCLGCACAVSNGQLFADGFAGSALGSSWAVQTGGFLVSGGLLYENSGTRYLDARLRWSTPTDTPNQFGKLEIEEVGTNSWGFQIRLDDPTGHHYEVQLPAGSKEWRWEIYDPGFVERVTQCTGDAVVEGGDWIGFAIDGSGSMTTVQVWRWGFDPDGSGVARPMDNWGTPDCIMQAQPSVDVADGRGLGIRSYTGGSTQGASIDSWTGGDLVGGECGNGLIEPGEECDAGGESSTCNANCTLAGCRDGVFNPLAEQCEFDLNCSVGEVCNASCLCEVPPPPAVCGNGILEGGEACDGGGHTPSCDADCTLPMCGDGELNPSAGEACEASADCAAGEVCLDCACLLSDGQLFSDDFGGAFLDPAWTVLNGSFAVSEGSLLESGGAPFTNTQLLWDGEPTDAPDQFAKLQLVDLGVRSWGFMLRHGDSSGYHYEVHLQARSSEWRWELYDPAFVERVGSCLGDLPPSPGDWLGVAIEGAGADTKVSVWRWNTDPDPGAPDPRANWGAPDCRMQVDPSVGVDDGRGMGVRSYTGAATSSSSIDNWSGGDLLEPIGDVGMGPITLVLSSSGAGTPGSMLDPDGIAVDSADNVYVAACGLSSASEGVFRITPAGEVTQVLDTTGDGVSRASCPVGVAVDSADNVYVANFLSDNVFRIGATGAITEVLDATGGGGAALAGPIGVAVDAFDNVYVTAHLSDNVFAMTASGDVEVILDASGGGTGTPLEQPFGVATDAAGNVFVAGFGATSNSVFKIAPDNTASIVLGPGGDGAGNPLEAPHDVTVDTAGNVYVTGNASDNVFRVTPNAIVTVIADFTGDGAGNTMDNPTSIAIDQVGNVYVAAYFSDNAFQIPPGGTPIEIIDALGDGTTPYGGASDFSMAVNSQGIVYTAGIDGDAVFRIVPPTPNDPYFSQLWGLHNEGQTGGAADADIDALEAWALSTGSSNVIVAILDTGIDTAHADLVDNLWTNPDEIPGNGIDDDGNGYVDDTTGWDFYNDDNDPFDDGGHGTHLAGIIGAVGNNGVGVTGVSHAVQIMPLKITNDSQVGSIDAAIAAINYAIAMGAHVMSNSWAVSGAWGVPGWDQPGFAPALQAAIEAANAAGIVFVASAGNSGEDRDQVPLFPGSYDNENIITVAATDEMDQMPSWSSFGATAVDVAAPGVGILSTVPPSCLLLGPPPGGGSCDGSGYLLASGTSMSTAYVAGVAALIQAHFPGINPAALKDRLTYGVDVLPDFQGITVSEGRVNAASALEDDAAPPEAIVDLTVVGATSGSVTLGFTAPGDDGAVGRARAYDVRYSTAPINTGNIANAARLPFAPRPLDAGSWQVVDVMGLDAATTYHLAVRGIDNVGNVGLVSNTPMSTTSP